MEQPLEDYRILNLDETARFYEPYTKPEGAQESNPFDTWEEANSYIRELEQLDRDSSVMVTIYGYIIHLEDYIKVVYKVKPLYT